MPVNLPNFLNAPIQKMVPDIFGEILQGYTMAQEPKRLRDEALQRELANQMAQMQNEFYPQVQQQNLDMGDVNLQSGRLNLDALPKQLQDEALLRSMNMDQMRTNNPLQTMLLNAKIQAQQASAKKSNFQSDPQAQIKYMQEVMASMGGDAAQGGNPQNFNNLTPLQRSVIEKATGLNLKPAPQTPEQKKKDALDLFKEKEDIKAAAKEKESLFAPTKAVQNQAQKTIIAVNTIKPLLNDLRKIAVPGKFEGNFKPAKKAFAESIQGLGVDEFQSIFNLAKNEHSTKLVEKLVDRRFRESLTDYRARLDDLFERIMHKGKMMNDVLENKAVKFDYDGASSLQDLTDEELEML